MKWHYEELGGHTHVDVFMNSGKCGTLCFRNEEFKAVREHCPWIQFIERKEQWSTARQLIHEDKLAKEANRKARNEPL